MNTVYVLTPAPSPRIRRDRLALARRRHRRRQRHRGCLLPGIPRLEYRIPAPSAFLTPILPGLQGLLAGPWLVAGVLGALIIRKPGAALYTELVAAVISALVGNQWGRSRSFRVWCRASAPNWCSFSSRTPSGACRSRSWRARAPGWRAGSTTASSGTRAPTPPSRSSTSSRRRSRARSSPARARGSSPRTRCHRCAGPVRLGSRSRSARLAWAARPAGTARGRRGARVGLALCDAPSLGCAGCLVPIAPGERVLLLGASGSGKSTVLHGLAGVLGGDDEGEQPANCWWAARRRPRARQGGHGPAGSRQPGDPRPGRRRRRLRVREPRRAPRRRSGRGYRKHSTRSDSMYPSTGRHPPSRAGRSSGSRSPASSRCGRA